MNYFLCLLVLLLSSCTSELSTNNQPQSFRAKSFEDKKHVGSTCSENCIWSAYAVKNGFQSKQAECIEGDCACVVINNARQICDFNQEPSTVIQSSTNENLNTQNRIKELPYYNQYNNTSYPSATCQNTSIAMVLSYFESAIHPDSIFADWGKDFAQSPSGLNAVYRSYASNSEIYTYTSASPEDLQSSLSEGFIAIVHGYFTNYGHVLVVRGYDNDYYYVNDPAGKWDGCFKCGYNGSYNGVTRYSKIAFENAVFTSNGNNYIPGWIHLIRKNNL